MDDALRAARSLLDGARGSRLAVLDALFRREATVAATDALAELGRPGVEALTATGLARADGSGIVGLVRLTRFGGNLIASDRMGFRRHADFVLGPGPATASLANAVRPIDGGRVFRFGLRLGY